MNIKPFKPCCKKAAIQAFLQKSFYLIGCNFCGTCFSITEDLQHFTNQLIASHKMNSNHPSTYDVVSLNGQIIFMLP